MNKLRKGLPGHQKFKRDLGKSMKIHEMGDLESTLWLLSNPLCGRQATMDNWLMSAVWKQPRFFDTIRDVYDDD
jgi:hypothetical protein